MKDIKVKFSQNGLYLMKNDFFVENRKSQKNDFSWVFRDGHICLSKPVCISSAEHNIFYQTGKIYGIYTKQLNFTLIYIVWAKNTMGVNGN